MAFLIAFGTTAACGSTDHGQPTPHSGGSSSAGGSGSSTAGSSTGGHSSGGVGMSGYAGTLAEAGKAAGGSAAGGQTVNGGAAGLSEGGATNVTEGGEAGAPEGGASGAGTCSPHCMKEGFGGFCGQSEVSWVCSTDFDRELLTSNCRDAFTNAIRYCCPAAFLADCH